MRREQSEDHSSRKPRAPRLSTRRPQKWVRSPGNSFWRSFRPPLVFAPSKECPSDSDARIPHVFLTAPYVYKVKKPVNFGFLDFSTLEKRRYFSEREISLNRRLSRLFIWELSPFI